MRPGGAADALQLLGRRESFAVVATLGEHARGELVAQPEQRAEQFMIRKGGSATFGIGE